jgi:predicted methyltransferase
MRLSTSLFACLLPCVAALLAACEKTPPDASTRPAATTSASAVSTAARPPLTASAPTASVSAAPALSFAVPARPYPVISSARTVVEAADRTPEDRVLDAGRHPAEMLSFFGIGAGMKVAELAAGGGYTAELLARAVGPTGKVYGVNSPMILERFAKKPWEERLARPVMKNVVRLDRNFDDPFPADLKGLDAVFDVLFYHDTVWQKIDRAKMNKAIFDALHPGGVYAIIDHSGRPGSGLSEVETLHRIDEAALREEILQAGFKLVAEGGFLRNPADTRDWNDSPRASAERRGTSDRFVFKFVRP